MIMFSKGICFFTLLCGILVEGNYQRQGYSGGYGRPVPLSPSAVPYKQPAYYSAPANPLNLYPPPSTGCSTNESPVFMPSANCEVGSPSAEMECNTMCKQRCTHFTGKCSMMPGHPKKCCVCQVESSYENPLPPLQISNSTTTTGQPSATEASTNTESPSTQTTEASTTSDTLSTEVSTTDIMSTDGTTTGTDSSENGTTVTVTPAIPILNTSTIALPAVPAQNGLKEMLTNKLNHLNPFGFKLPTLAPLPPLPTLSPWAFPTLPPLVIPQLPTLPPLPRLPTLAPLPIFGQASSIQPAPFSKPPKKP